MKLPSILILIIAITILVVSNIGCAGIPVVKRSSCGPSGISMWKYRNYPYRTSEETEKFEQELQRKIDGYLSRHPITDENLRFNFKELGVVAEGMNKEMVELLYGRPDTITKDPAQLKYNADEKWVYESNSGDNRIYFNNGIVIALETKYYEEVLP